MRKKRYSLDNERKRKGEGGGNGGRRIGRKEGKKKAKDEQ